MAGTERWESLRGTSGLRAAGVAVVALSAGACAVALPLEADPAVTTGASPTWLVQLAVVASAGLLVVWARPRNAIGWLLVLSVALQAVSLATSAYAQQQYATPDPGPGSYTAALMAEWAWFPSLVLPVAVLPSIYPSGRPETRLRRSLATAGVVGVVAMCVELGAVLGPTDILPGVALPYSAPGWVSVALLGTAAAALLLSVVGGLVAAFVRMLRSSTPERQQLLWLLTALVPFTVGYFFTIPYGGFGYAYFGAAVAVGVLRYRLLDIDLVVRRTLFYVPLIALVALAIAAVSTAVARLAPSGPLPLLGAAAVVAVLVGPVSAGLRRTVDRFVLGERADPLTAVSRVASGGETGQDGALASVLAALVDAVQVPYAAIVDDRGRELAVVGTPTRDQVETGLRAGGGSCGALVCSPPPDEPGRRILAALAPHIATLLLSLRLAAEVDEQRRRVETAATEERERIRADLHDSLGPSLSGIALGLQAVDGALAGEEPVARSLLRRVRDEADAAVREVRRALDALGPAALDRVRLGVAVREAAEHLGLGETGGPAFTCDVQVGRLPPEVADTAYRIITEALHNVVRHAHATCCAVSLTDRDDHLHVRIRDDGVGVRPSGAHQGVGLSSMRRRALASGGTFALCSRPETPGTVVDVDLPLAVGS